MKGLTVVVVAADAHRGNVLVDEVGRRFGDAVPVDLLVAPDLVPDPDLDDLLAVLRRERPVATVGGWWLVISDHELPSEALVGRLRAGGWDDGVGRLLIPVRRVHPDGTTVLTGPRWPLDLQPRLFRISPGVPPDPPSGHLRVIEEPLLDLASVGLDDQARQRAARRSERLAPGRRGPAGLTRAVEHYGLPDQAPTDEVRAGARLALLSPMDFATVTALAAGASRPATDAPRAASESATPGDIDPEAPRDDGRVEIVEVPASWTVGRPRPILVRVTNASDRIWQPHDDQPVRVGVRFFAGDRAVGEEARIELPAAVAPGEAVLANGEVVTPAGADRLVVDLVREHVAWFDQSVDLTIEVVDAKRIIVTGGFSPYRHLGDDLIIRAVLAALAFQLPDHEVTLLADVPAQASAAYGPPAVQGANPMLHRGAPAGTALALRRIEALRRDAKRVRAGQRPHDPLHAPLLDALAGARALVAPGAGWFTSKYRIEQMLPRLAEVEAARALGVPVLFESGTIGPFDHAADRLLARRLLAGLSGVSVRDGARSAEVARSLGASNVLEIPDAATAAEPSESPARDAWLVRHGIDPSGPYAVVSVRDTRDPTAVGDTDATVETLVGALGVVAQAGIPALFLPHCIVHETDDRPAGHAVAERVPLVMTQEMPPDDVAVALIHGAALTVGNRFHLALVADSAGTPALFLASTPFDAQRAGAFSGGNVRVVDAEPTGQAGSTAARDALGTGRGDPAARWDEVDFARRLHAAMDLPAR